MKPKLIVFASGTKDGSSSTTPLGFSKTEYRQENLGGGGSGFENLVNATKSGVLDAGIVAVVSSNEYGSVRERASRLGIPFIYFSGSYDPEHYRKVVADSGAEWVALSGWLKLVKGLDPTKTFNIHPALLSQLDHRFGGRGMYGRHIHEAVKAALDAGEIMESGFSMHFVTDEMDRGPVFFEHRVSLTRGMTAEEIAKAVNLEEHKWQPKITNMVIHGQIHWDGTNPSSLVVPKM